VFFNAKDVINVSGFLRTITVHFAAGKLPSSQARIWVYGIVGITGSYIACSNFEIAPTQISTNLTIQTYTLPNDRINVFSGSHIGIGIQDTTAAIMSVNDGLGLVANGAYAVPSVLSGAPLYFRPLSTRSGLKVTYTIWT
jgi:hypothetical protein